METVQIAEPLGSQTATATFETVWATLDRIAQRHEESKKEFDLKMNELRESQKETDRKISRLGSRIGELIEHFAASNLLEKFDELGFEFNTISQNIIIKNKRKEHLAEIDILLEDGEYVMVVEVKSLLNKTHVEEHQERMKTVREHANRPPPDTRKYLAAVAGATIDGTAREYALESGMYVIEQTGDTVRVKAPPTLTYW